MIKYRSRTFTVIRTQMNDPPGRFLNCAQDVADLIRAIFAEQDADREHFLMLALNTKHKVIGHKLLFSGTADASSTYPRDVVLAALRLDAVAVIVAHNHPSGDPEPSAADRVVTRDLKAACRLLEIILLDHIILGGSRHFSFAEAGLL